MHGDGKWARDVRAKAPQEKEQSPEEGEPAPRTKRPIRIGESEIRTIIELGKFHRSVAGALWGETRVLMHFKFWCLTTWHGVDRAPALDFYRSSTCAWWPGAELTLRSRVIKGALRSSARAR